jgi:hypothetical protein
MKKDFRGLGIPNLQDLNICIICYWIKRYIESESVLWKRVFVSKYNTKTFCLVMIYNHPHFENV